MKAICENCKVEIEIEPYVYNEDITAMYYPMQNQTEFKAVASVKFFCNNCGHLHDYKGIEKTISKKEIGEMVKSVIPFYAENGWLLKELRNER